MNEYTRNSSMVVCIVGVLIVGAVIVGVLAYNSTIGWGWRRDNWLNTTEFYFSEKTATPPALVALNVTINVGTVNINFVEDPTVVYNISIRVPNDVLAKYGDPAVAYNGTAIQLGYEAGTVDILLGKEIAYEMHVLVNTGNINLNLSDESQVVNALNLSTSVGNIGFSMTSGAAVSDNITYMRISSNTGNVYVDIAAPTNIGVSFVGTTSVGNVDVQNDGWSMISENVYQTTNYDVASQRIAIIATVNTGNINAILH